jgi:hypothetical protein
MEKNVKLKSPAWLLRGISSLPGELKVANGRLTYKAFGFGTFWRYQLERLEKDSGVEGLADRLDNGETAGVLDMPVSEVNARFPWYYFSGGLVIETGGAVYKFSFGRPASSGSSIGNRDLARALNELRTAGSMRTTGKTWRKALGL